MTQGLRFVRRGGGGDGGPEQERQEGGSRGREQKEWIVLGLVEGSGSNLGRRRYLGGDEPGWSPLPSKGT